MSIKLPDEAKRIVLRLRRDAGAMDYLISLLDELRQARDDAYSKNQEADELRRQICSEWIKLTQEIKINKEIEEASTTSAGCAKSP